MKLERDSELARSTLGAGCFWCVEAIYQGIKGIKSVKSGYMGGNTFDPVYEEICTGHTGHAEVVDILFDTKIITYEKILDYFWLIHDPTTLNRQGADSGTQYRSIIFTYSEKQYDISINSKLRAQSNFDNKIVTKIEPASKFYEAEDYHQNFYSKNPSNQYCEFVIKPKLELIED